MNQLSPVQTSADFTDRDLSKYMGAVAGKGGIRVQFFYQRVQTEFGPALGCPFLELPEIFLMKLPVSDTV